MTNKSNGPLNHCKISGKKNHDFLTTECIFSGPSLVTAKKILDKKECWPWHDPEKIAVLRAKGYSKRILL